MTPRLTKKLIAESKAALSRRVREIGRLPDDALDAELRRVLPEIGVGSSSYTEKRTTLILCAIEDALPGVWLM